MQEFQNEPTLTPEAVSSASTLTLTMYEPTPQRDRAQIFEPLPPPQTDWTQDIEQLLLGPRGSRFVSVSPPLRSPALSAPDAAPPYDRSVPAPPFSCDEPMEEIDINEDFDLDELLLRLTGHEPASASASAFTL